VENADVGRKHIFNESNVIIVLGRLWPGGPGVLTPDSTRTTHEIRKNPRTGRKGKKEKEREREGGERRKSFGHPHS
jgi:hypothetical protein